MCEKEPPAEAGATKVKKRLKKLSCSKNEEILDQILSDERSYDSLEDFVAPDDTISREDVGLDSASCDSDIAPVLGVKRSCPATRNQRVVKTEFNNDDDGCITQTFYRRDRNFPETNCPQPMVVRPFYNYADDSGREYSKKTYAAKLHLKRVTGENLFDHKPPNPRKSRKK